MRKLLVALAVFAGLAGAFVLLARADFPSLGQALRQDAVAKNADAMFRDAAAPVSGNPKAETSIVVFFDYNCPECRQAEPELQRLMKEEPDVRLVSKELPILSAESEAVARIALAAAEQGSYWQLHDRLFEERGRLNETRALRVAEDLGLDVQELKRDGNSERVTAAIEANRTLARRLDLPGVPYIFVGDRPVLPGPNLGTRIKDEIAALRRDGCEAAC